MLRAQLERRGSNVLYKDKEGRTLMRERLHENCWLTAQERSFRGNERRTRGSDAQKSQKQGEAIRHWILNPSPGFQKEAGCVYEV